MPNYVCPVCGEELKFKKSIASCFSHQFDQNTIETAKPSTNVFLKTGFNSKVVFTYSFYTDYFFIVDTRGGFNDFHGPFSVSKIKEVIVEVNNNIILKTSFNPTAMIAGGVLFGGLGAIAGSNMAGNKTKTKSKDTYKISISIDNLSYPGIFFETKDGDAAYKLANAINALRDKYVEKINENSKTVSNFAENKVELANNQIKSEDIPDVLRKYKELFDDGIITEEEFLKIKNKLLNF